MKDKNGIDITVGEFVCFYDRFNKTNVFGKITDASDVWGIDQWVCTVECFYNRYFRGPANKYKVRMDSANLEKIPDDKAMLLMLENC